MKLQRWQVFALFLAVGTALSPAPAAAQGRATRDMPYATSFTINVGSGSGVGASSPDPVPSNKRLIIEFVSVVATAQPGEKPSVSLNDSVNSYARSYWIPLTLIGTAPSGVEVYGASQLVKLNHEGNGVNGPGALCARGVNSFVPLTCQITISGTLVDK